MLGGDVVWWFLVSNQLGLLMFVGFLVPYKQKKLGFPIEFEKAILNKYGKETTLPFIQSWSYQD